jgi:anti-sigma B factor antagonist
MEFGYQISDKPKYTLIQLSGNLMEKSQARDLLEEINGYVIKETPNFVIDFSDFKYMNSTGLNVLLNILSLARKSGGEAVVCCVPEKIKTLLVITKLVNVFSVAENEQTAAESLAQ